MKMKKIIAPTMAQAITKVKSELGEQAVILQSKEISAGGFLGLFKKKKFEVIAVLDQQRPTPMVQREKNENKTLAKVTHRNLEDNEQNLKLEIEALKKEIRNNKQPITALQHYPPQLQQCLTKLMDVEMNENHVNYIGSKLLEKWRTSLQEPTDDQVYAWMSNEVELQLSNQSFRKQQNKRFINIVGPTGVGKTTTIAKLAAEAVLEEKKKVAFITLDTYRIAAIDQLKTYAELLNVPVEVVYEPADLQKAIDQLKEYDLVLIDTAGRNYRDESFVTELNRQFSGIDIETLLALPISMKEKDLRKIIDNFLSFGVDYFLFTKADETRSYGAMYNLIIDYERGAAYITNGQEVPNDFKVASAKQITSYILGDQNDT